MAEQPAVPLNPEKFEIINSLSMTLNWDHRFVQLVQKPKDGIVVVRPIVMLVGVDDMMLLAAQILQCQSHHNKAILAQAMRSGVLDIRK